MKKIVVSFFLLAVLSVTAMAQYQQQQEKDKEQNTPLAGFADCKKTLFNFGWKFMLKTEANKGTDFASPSLDDSAWRTLDLPHDFQFEQPWGKGGGGARGFKPMCDGWYRKTFRAEECWKGKRVTLDFGGIIYLGDVYVNGRKVASTEYGYVGFEADITPYLRYDRDNVVAVYASTGPKKASRWYTGGGIFRDVWLTVSNPTHIVRHGVFVTTPEVSRQSATVQVQVEVTGWQKHDDVSIRATLLDRQGNVVGRAKAAMPRFTKHETEEVAMPLMTVSNPELWGIDTPVLYAADVVLEADGMVVDSVREAFGIRKIEFSPEYGFRLNGEKVFLKGNAGHHDMGALGAAAFDKGIERMMLRLKEFGYNCIRCSHNPYSESFTKIADRVGMLVVDELIDKWSDNAYWGGRKPFTSVWPGLTTEWVKRDRNSPSVILWSLGNELQIREEWTGYKGFNDWGVTMYRIMEPVVKRWDPTRRTTVAQFPARAGAIGHRESSYKQYTMPPELACVTEVASLNYQSDWYGDFLRQRPELILFQSEAETHKWLAPYYNMDYDRNVGMAYWGSVEYWGESNRWPKKGWNYSFFDHTCHPYPQAYLVRSAFKAEEPVVRLGVLDVKGTETVNWNDVNVGQKAMLDHWNFPAGSRQQVYVFTNTHSVELVVNGKSFGSKVNDGKENMRNVIMWQDVEYGNGGTVTAIARDDKGREVARHEMQTAGKAVKLIVEPETKTLKADGMDLLYLNITAVDGKGRVAADCDDSLAVTVEGAATLLAMDNHDHYTDDLFHGVSTKKMRRGRMQVILRAGREAGKITVKAETKRMKTTFKTTSK